MNIIFLSSYANVNYIKANYKISGIASEIGISDIFLILYRTFECLKSFFVKWYEIKTYSFANNTTCRLTTMNKRLTFDFN